MLNDLCVNQIYRDISTNERFRTLWLSPDRSRMYVYQLGSEKGFPVSEDPETISEGIERGLYELVEDETSFGIPTPEDEKRRDEIWGMMGEALQNEPSIFEKDERSGMLDEIAKKYDVRKNNLYRHLRRYWERGKTKDAFLPISRAGKSRQVISSVKRGRKSKTSDRGIPLTEKDKERIDKAIRKYYLARQELTLEQSYQRMLAESYSTRTPQEGGNDRIVFLPEDQMPSFNQFYYRYMTQFRSIDAIRSRKGEKEYELNHTANLHRADSRINGPGTEYQVDATIADIYLVSAFNRADLIGRPVVYFVIDVFSRIVTGMYIGLEGPSWSGMMMALYNASTDKVSYCREFDIEISEDQWPCHHLPDRYIGDRGELLSRKADVLASSLDVRIDNAPPYRGDLKPFIERFFKTADGRTSILIPGKVKPDMKERGGRDYRLDAKLTLREFTRIMIRTVLDYNQHKVLEHYEPSEPMLRSGIDVIPLQLWNWGIRNCSGNLRVMPEKRIRLALMPQDTGSITDKGIRFKNLFYTCPEFEKLDLYAQARADGAEKVTVSYDPRDMARIYVRRSGENAVNLCGLLDWEDKYCGKSEEETRYEMLRQDVRRNALKRTEEEARANLDEFVRHEVENAEASYKASVPEMTKAERLKDMKEKRAEARQELRSTEAFTGQKYSKCNGAPETENQEGDTRNAAMSPTMKKIRAHVDSRLKISGHAGEEGAGE